MTVIASGRKIEGDWYEGGIPAGIEVDSTAFIETAYSFHNYRSELSSGFRAGVGASVYMGTMFDVGRRGRVSVGDSSMLNGVRVICDAEISIGNHVLISWNVVLMDSYRVSRNAVDRRLALRGVARAEGRRLDGGGASLPIIIGNNVWIGFNACVLPGVTIGDGAVIGARSVVIENIDAYTVVAGNPSRPLRKLNPPEAGIEPGKER